MKNKTLNNSTIFCFLLISVAVCLAYYNVVFADFISWDDADFTINNKDVKGFNIKAFFTNFYLGNYSPLTLISFSIDYFFGGNMSWIYHLHNIILHVVISVFVFSLFNNLQKNKTLVLFVALIFALHPMQTESVSWISERKNLLCGLFYILSLVLYLRYTKNSSAINYLLVLIAFVFALFSKGMAVSLPITLFALDFWSNRVFTKKVFIEKIPFFILSFVFGIIAIKAQSSAGFLKADHQFSLVENLLFSGYAFMLYLLRFFIPIHLSAIYPYPKTDFNSFFLLGIILFLASLSVLLFAIRKNKRIIAGGLLFFIGNIIFVLQFIESGAVLMADHYVYIACLGIIFPCVYFIFYLFKTTKFAIIISSVIAIILLAATHQRNLVWKNGISFWEDIAKKYPNSEIAISSLGAEYMLIGETSKSYACLNQAINLNPNYLKAYYNRGLLFAKNNRFEEALIDFTKAAESKNYTKAFVSRAEVYYTLKNYSKAISDVETVFKTDHDNIGANYIIANCYSDLNQLSNALIHYNKCINLNSNEATFYLRRAIVFGKLQKFSECLNDLEVCTKLNPNFAEAYYWKGVAKVNLKQNPCLDFQKALNFGYQIANGPFSKYCK